MLASGSLLMATMVLAPDTPAMCWLAPERAMAMYRVGLTILPVRPICWGTGYQPRSQAARVAPVAPPRIVARSSSSLNASGLPMPRPPHTTASASSKRTPAASSLRPSTSLERARPAPPAPPQAAGGTQKLQRDGGQAAAFSRLSEYQHSTFVTHGVSPVSGLDELGFAQLLGQLLSRFFRGVALHELALALPHRHVEPLDGEQRAAGPRLRGIQPDVAGRPDGHLR